MSNSLLLPKFSPPTRLYQVKVCALACLVFLSLLLLVPSTQAQGPGGGWSASPCDAQGNLLTDPLQRNGFYQMGGTKSGTASNTYPAPWVDSLGMYPPSGGASPLTVTTISTMYADPHVGIAGYPTYGSFASNELADGTFYYTVPGSSGLINGSVTTHLDGHLVYYFLVQWSGGGTPTSQMPQTISLLLNTNLFASTTFNYGTSNLTSGLSASASASVDAFKETASSSGPTYVAGYHLVQASVSPMTATAGIAQTYLDGTVDQTASDPIPAGAYAAGHGYYPTNGPTTASADSEVSAGVRQDSRAVTITSSIDPTYHKDPATSQPVQNQPDSDGTINADSVQLGDVSGAAITYFGNPVGYWAANSSYHWYSALTDYSGSGTFTLHNDPPYGLDVPYGNNVNFANQEHINLHCIDASDGASGTGNYYVNWHNDFDDWITVVDTKDYGPLTRVTAVYHPLDDAKYSADFENTVKVDVKATGEGALGTDKIGAKFGAEIGAEYETSTKVTTEYTWVANKYNWIERQSFWHHREGTVDNYGFHGYMGLLHWTLDSAYNPGNPLVIDFLESQRAEDAGPAY